jgi:hypothetical protein
MGVQSGRSLIVRRIGIAEDGPVNRERHLVHDVIVPMAPWGVGSLASSYATYVKGDCR